MAVTITWKISQEFHNNETEKWIYMVLLKAIGTETVDSKAYESTVEQCVELSMPATLIDYSTFNKQETLVNAAKAVLETSGITILENMLKDDIYKQQHPLSSIPPD